ncbi:unnamed protein product [Boreogadus saida]
MATSHYTGVPGLVFYRLEMGFGSTEFATAPQAGASELEVISQQVEEDHQAGAPIQLVSFTYRDLPLAALDVSLAGSQLISNPDEEDNRDG